MKLYQNNIKSLDNLRQANKKINNVELTLKKKYIRNKKETDDLNKLLDDSLDKYHSIIKNLDKVIFNSNIKI